MIRKNRKQKRKQMGYGEECPKCCRLMKRYCHPDGWVPKPTQLYYSYWDICRDCRHIQMYEAAKRGPWATPYSRSYVVDPREDWMKEPPWHDDPPWRRN
jgi:hypothetical protein